MTEEVKVTMPDGVEEGDDHAPEATPPSETPQFTEVELEAMKHGWKPESEFVAKNGRKWKSAERFMEDKPLYDKIDEQHKLIKRTEKQVDIMRQHYERVEQDAFERAVAELKAQRKQALEEGDLVRAEEIRDELQEKQAKAPRPQVAQPDPTVAPAMQEWRGRNEWYEKDEDMTAFADGLGNKLLAKGLQPTEILEAVEKKVREAFPQKFVKTNPNRATAPRVEGGSKKSSASSASDTSFMTAEEVKFMEGMLRAGVPITREEYIRDMKKSKGVK